MEKMYYKIGEVAEILGEEVSAVRFWADSFSKFIKPERNAKNNRIFRKDDVETLKLIHFLIKDQGMTLAGARKRLEDNREGLEFKMAVTVRLKEIRRQLVEVKESL